MDINKDDWEWKNETMNETKICIFENLIKLIKIYQAHPGKTFKKSQITNTKTSMDLIDNLWMIVNIIKNCL